jgi:hypothetical protein
LVKIGYWEAATALVLKAGEERVPNKQALKQMAIDEKKRADKFIATLDAVNRIQT